MKFSPPGSEPFRTLRRVDGWIGDLSGIPYSAAQGIAANLPPLAGRTEIERIRTRMMVRQMKYERKKKIIAVWRRKFGLQVR